MKDSLLTRRPARGMPNSLWVSSNSMQSFRCFSRISSMRIGGCDDHPSSASVFGQKRRRVALDSSFGKVRNEPCSFDLQSSSASLKSPLLRRHLSFAFCASRASRAMSSALSPLAVRNSAASSTG